MSAFRGFKILQTTTDGKKTSSQFPNPVPSRPSASAQVSQPLPFADMRFYIFAPSWNRGDPARFRTFSFSERQRDFVLPPSPAQHLIRSSVLTHLRSSHTHTPRTQAHRLVVIFRVINAQTHAALVRMCCTCTSPRTGHWTLPKRNSLSSTLHLLR